VKSSQFDLTNISWNYRKTSKNHFVWRFFRQLNCAQVIFVIFFVRSQNKCARISTYKKWVTLVSYLVMIIWLSRIMVIWVISPDLPAYYTNSKREKDISKDRRRLLPSWNEKAQLFKGSRQMYFICTIYIQMAWMKAILMCWENIFVGGPIYHGKWPRFSQLNVSFRPTSCHIDDMHNFSADMFCNVIWPKKKFAEIFYFCWAKNIIILKCWKGTLANL